MLGYAHNNDNTDTWMPLDLQILRIFQKLETALAPGGTKTPTPPSALLDNALIPRSPTRGIQAPLFTTSAENKPTIVKAQSNNRAYSMNSCIGTLLYEEWPPGNGIGDS